jgi:hypothetical protein
LPERLATMRAPAVIEFTFDTYFLPPIFYNLIALLQAVWEARPLDPVENTLPAS